MVDPRRLAWLFVGLTLATPFQPALAAPGFTSSCDRVMPKEQVDELFEAVRGVAGTCQLVRVDTQLFRTQLEWEHDGRRLGVMVAPRGCLLEPSVEGDTLAMSAPAQLSMECPEVHAALATFLGRPREVAPLAPFPGEVATQPVPDAKEAPVLESFAALATLALALGWAIFFRSRRPADAASSGWWWLGLGAFGLALLARFSVEASVANWYGAFLPLDGWGERRFGSMAEVLQAGARAVLPWTAESAFGLFRVTGALAVPLTIALVRRFDGSLGAAAVAGLLVALEPIPVRVSASSSEHVIAATFALAAWVCWQTAASDARWAPRVLGVLLAWLAVLTRADCLPQLLLLPVFTLVGQPLGPGVTLLPLRRRLLDAAGFTLALALVGVHAWVTIILPSHHPRPDLDSIARTAGVLFTQFWVIARQPPHWLTWPAFALAVGGCVSLAVLSRWRLLVAAGLGCALLFVPLGRNLTNDGLTGARYFVLLMPLLGLLSGAAAELVGRRLPEARRRMTAVALLLVLVAVEVASAQSGWRSEFTFQAEYRFLASALRARGDELNGCTLWFVRPRQPTGELDLDCCLWPSSSPLTLVAPRLRFRPMPSEPAPDDAEGCHLFYEGAVCALEAHGALAPEGTTRLVQQCDALRSRPGVLLHEEQVTDQALNPLFRSRPWVRLRARGL